MGMEVNNEHPMTICKGNDKRLVRWLGSGPKPGRKGS